MSSPLEDDWRRARVIRVSSDIAAESYDLWAVEQKAENTNVKPVVYKYRLRVYKVYNNSTQPLYTTNITLPDRIDVPSPGDMYSIGSRFYLAYDGVGNVFMSDSVNSAIHLLSVDGTYVRQLVALHEYSFGEPSPLSVSVSVDCNSNVIYIGLCNGTIVMLTLIYNDQNIA